MNVFLTDVHDSHGAVFTLNLNTEKGRTGDKGVIGELKRILRHSPAGKQNGGMALYSYDVKFSQNGLSLSFAEQTKQLAKVDYRWNPQREDQKFVVLVVEGDPENTEFFGAPGFSCYWCNREVSGVQRDTIDVYDKKQQALKTVSVHHECRLAREKQIADVRFVS